jgi:hypothetical protein
MPMVTLPPKFRWRTLFLFPSLVLLLAPQDLDAENVPPVRRDALRLIEGVEEGDRYIGMSERVLEELRVLCENDAKEAMEDTHHDRMMALQAEDSEVPVAGPSTDPVERYVGVVRDFSPPSSL